MHLCQTYTVVGKETRHTSQELFPNVGGSPTSYSISSPCTARIDRAVDRTLVPLYTRRTRPRSTHDVEVAERTSRNRELSK